MNKKSMLAYKEDRILTTQQLKKLSEHKYQCNNASLLDPWLQPWWNCLVSKTPLWLAPNLITIVGLIVNVVTTLILVGYSPGGITPPPRWTCLLCAFGLFVYQSLDSIDGKQARRTNTSSPLGELFDHGCDSISTVFIALSACISCQLGHYPNWLFFQCFCAIGLFYCAHWQTYVSGTLRFGKIDVTEAQLTIIGIHLISTVFGPEFWLTKGTSVLSPSIPLTLVILPAFIIAKKSPENIFSEHASLYIIAFGLVAAKVTNKLVIAHMTKAEMEYLDWSLLGPGLLFLNQYFNCVVPEIWLLWFTLIWATQDLMRYCAQVCLEICAHLHIDLFTIPYPPRTAVTQGTSTNTNSASISSSSDKNGATHHRRASRQTNRKH
ncbi:choline/ethanolaminephosphotransferase 1 isoform X5 [Glossina fuscipes]|uniref:diacylglycerol cholinephosphotransferase n=1 Tax=Glossina fuscipes TaxID=7396 RepID=A0A9C5YVN7_9MUSC|nr:choline/ethanolaminephosphotransferase 1 isoform X5 [Glossina fuscipes]